MRNVLYLEISYTVHLESVFGSIEPQKQTNKSKKKARTRTFCPFVLLSFCPFVLLSFCPFVLLLFFCLFAFFVLILICVLLSLCPFVLFTFCLFVHLSFCPFVFFVLFANFALLIRCPFAFLSLFPFVLLSFGPLILLYFCIFVRGLMSIFGGVIASSYWYNIWCNQSNQW